MSIESISPPSATRPPEFSPSEVRADSSGFAQFLGLGGVGFAVLGLIVIVMNQYGPRLIPSNGGYLLAAAGLAGMIFHALRDPAVEFRRPYIYFGGVLALLAAVAAFIPGPIFGSVSALGAATAKTAGYHFLPWTPALGLLSLIFLVTPLRHETDDVFGKVVQFLLLALGTILCLGSVGFGLKDPASLVGPGILLGLLGVGFILAFLSQVDSADGPGHLVATLLGVLGAATILTAFGRTVFPTMLYDGPQALRNAFQEYDKWRLLARGAVVVGLLGFAAWAGMNRGFANWLRASLVAVGVSFAGVFTYAALKSTLMTEPAPFLVPGGLLLTALGLVYLAVSVSIVSESQFVTLTRRELSSFFYSPIAYLVLFANAVVAWIGYLLFVSQLVPGVREVSIPEPILQNYWGATMGAAFAIVFFIPVITMRTFSEEKRSGTLELLLTAPVNEPILVLSKFFATWLFFLIGWLPIGLYLIVVRDELGQFDYRPVLSYYAASAAVGAGFVAMGIFFSSMTKNQLVAAVLTFAGMFFMLLTIVVPSLQFVPTGLQSVLSKFNFFGLWEQTLGGQLPLSNVLVHGSLCLFWLYLTVKVLEARKWS